MTYDQLPQEIRDLTEAFIEAAKDIFTGDFGWLEKHLRQFAVNTYVAGTLAKKP